jgi:hypothetical protein
VDAQNSQKKSPRSSAKSKHDTTGASERSSHKSFDEDEYFDRSIDHVARVRAAKEAAQREMESFSDVSEYDISIIQGQLKEEPIATAQSSLDFQDGDSAHAEEEA